MTLQSIYIFLIKREVQYNCADENRDNVKMISGDVESYYYCLETDKIILYVTWGRLLTVTIAVTITNTFTVNFACGVRQ